jgi:formylglycine-generating enzyme required for sulfatase activity
MRRLALVSATGAVSCSAILGIAPIPDLVGATPDGGPDVVEGAAADGSDASEGPSCRGARGAGLSDCGLDGGESCCTSLPVPGGKFLRSYDAVANKDASSPATVSAFRLDRFEVTIGRFRPFAAAVVSGWRPKLGDGEHVHLNGGRGLAAAPNDAGIAFESGWDISWNTKLDSLLAPDAGLSCGDFTSAPTENDRLAIGCIDWFAAYAFCIWDGGFLPSEAEWNFAAAGGAEQRYYPWSNPPTSTAIDCTYANTFTGGAVPGCADGGPWRPGFAPRGDGRFGQADLGGNIYEWTADYYGDYPVPCDDCFAAAPVAGSTIRGSSFDRPSQGASAADRAFTARSNVIPGQGVRCARAP